MPWLRSTFTRRTGLTTVNLPVKYAEISSPRDAFSAISSTDKRVLDVFGIALFFLFGRLPGCDEMIVLAIGVMPDLENNGAESPTTPADSAELLWVVVLLVDQVCLVENLCR